MDDDWEKIADNPKSKIASDVNKWAGEDEEDPKDSWEDALEDEKKDEEKMEIPVKIKKTAQQRIAEKEKMKREQAEKLKQEDEDTANLTPEEKIRLQKLQEEEYTRAALDTLGLTSNAAIDSFNPKTKEEFAEFGDVLCKKISHFKAQDEYVTFLDDFVRNLLAGLSSVNIRKVKTTIDNLYLEKQKIEKGDKQKKKTGAGKVRTKLRVEDDDDYASRANYSGGAFEDDDYDDFM
ncbi:eukaryotic translation initiation factor 3 subunit J [Chironomus tepperi]|uniref:eukaryotic translation initiation factor 3 subunit J n=1 Tax=Chironomus tepperi TaxID=113505 RepID=UPI00391F9D84